MESTLTAGQGGAVSSEGAADCVGGACVGGIWGPAPAGDGATGGWSEGVSAEGVSAEGVSADVGSGDGRSMALDSFGAAGGGSSS